MTAGSILVEACEVEPELDGIPLQIVVLERLLAMVEQLVHVPEPALECGCLGCGRRRERVRMDLHQREVSEREADITAQLLLDALDLSKRLPRIGAFVVAVLEDETTGRRAADVIENVV